MNKVALGGIIGAIILVGIILGVIFSSEKDTIEVEDGLNKEIEPVDNPEIQEKLDEIEKNNLENRYSPKEREWITSGPFQIDRSEYILGEKIFLRIGLLDPDDKGQVVFLRPMNNTHYSVYSTVPFDGMKNFGFNYYVEPDLSKYRDICTIEDLIGDWRVVFRGTDYPNLEFRVIDQILPGDEPDYEPVC